MSVTNTNTNTNTNADTDTDAAPKISQAEAQRGFSRSIAISGIRCLLTYLIFPFAPLIGLSAGIGPVVGLLFGTFALVANVFSIRRFWRADHRWKKHITVLHVSVIVLLVVLMYRDIAQLAG